MEKINGLATRIGSFGKRMLKSNLNYAVFMFSVIGILAGLWSFLGGMWAIAFAATVMVFFALVISVKS
jgi:hypothetical protein